MEPAVSERNLTPSSTDAGSAPSTMAGVGLFGQIIAVGMLTVMLSGRVTVSSPANTSATKLNVPSAVGVPEITPEFAASVSPGGSAPLAIDQVYGGVPPSAVRPVEYATPIEIGRAHV